MKFKVCKFGGTSLATAGQFAKVKHILEEDDARKYVVASAPGKRQAGDIKVTDLLLNIYEHANKNEDYFIDLQKVKDRFADIINDLKIDFDLNLEFVEIENNIKNALNKDYLASRGEYLNSKILATYLGFEFVDATNFIHFDDKGIFLKDETNVELQIKLKKVDKAVVPGFYGVKPNGEIKTFSRGGSDITGSLLAKALGAEVYENWTDVPGVYDADPRIVENPKVIDYLTYEELRELSYMGASVLHEDAVFPVREVGIPINLRNTNNILDEGTMIASTIPKIIKPRVITGIAGKAGFSSILVEKSSMNSEVGFAAKLLNILADYNIPLEHMPTGIDTMSVIIETKYLDNIRRPIIKKIKEELNADVCLIEDKLALIAVVGIGMAYAKGVASKVFTAVSNADVNIRMINQGSSEMNIILAVEDKDLNKTINAIYAAFNVE